MRSATEEDYKNRQNWSVGTFHTVSTLPTTEASSGEEMEPEMSETILRNKAESVLPAMLKRTGHLPSR